MLEGKWVWNPGLSNSKVCALSVVPAHCPRVPSTVINAEDTECKIHVWEELVLSSTGGLWERHGRPGEEPSLGGGCHPFVLSGSSSALRTTELVFLRSSLSWGGFAR